MTTSLAIMGRDARFTPRRIYCVGRNYAAHVMEMNEGADPRDPPFFFQKPTDALVETGSTIPYPPMTDDLQYEVELVAAIAVGGQNIAVESALDHVGFYGIGIDLTRRDLQFRSREKSWPWEMGKSFDHSAPVGPLSAASSIGHGTRSISLSVDGEMRQNSTTDHMIWSVTEIVANLSRYYLLVPGDLIMTGTPEGVGAVIPGQTIEAIAEGIQPLSITIGARI